MLKKCLAIWLSLVFLFVQTPLHELMKIPILISHYQEHLNKNTSLDLMSFLDMHYADTDKHDEDHDKDMQLPFKDHQDHVCSFVFVCLECNTFQTKPIIQKKESGYPNPDKNQISPFLTPIFQPPRLS